MNDGVVGMGHEPSIYSEELDHSLPLTRVKDLCLVPRGFHELTNSLVYRNYIRDDLCCGLIPTITSNDDFIAIPS